MVSRSSMNTWINKVEHQGGPAWLKTQCRENAWLTLERYDSGVPKTQLRWHALRYYPRHMSEWVHSAPLRSLAKVGGLPLNALQKRIQNSNKEHNCSKNCVSNKSCSTIPTAWRDERNVER